MLKNSKFGAHNNPIKIRDNFLLFSFHPYNSDRISCIFNVFKVFGSVTKSHLQNMDPSERKCLFPHENDYLNDKNLLGFINQNYRPVRIKRQEVNVARSYSTSGCEYECKLLQAFNLCKCVPWHHPQFRTIYSYKSRTADYELACRFGKICEFLLP